MDIEKYAQNIPAISKFWRYNVFRCGKLTRIPKFKIDSSRDNTGPQQNFLQWSNGADVYIVMTRRICITWETPDGARTTVSIEKVHIEQSLLSRIIQIFTQTSNKPLGSDQSNKTSPKFFGKFCINRFCFLT